MLLDEKLAVNLIRPYVKYDFKKKYRFRALDDELNPNSD